MSVKVPLKYICLPKSAPAMASFEPPRDTRIYRQAHIFSGNGDYLGGLFVQNPPQASNAAVYRLCTHFINFPPLAQPNK
ncbi:hypothetical protein BJX64DRAFT_271428 [Aspergillus heterothallicus]